MTYQVIVDDNTSQEGLAAVVEEYATVRAAYGRIDQFLNAYKSAGFAIRKRTASGGSYWFVDRGNTPVATITITDIGIC